MGEVTVKLTVFFENPFWVGIFERQESGMLSAAKVTFGAEPKDHQVYEFVLRHGAELRFSPAVPNEMKAERGNPKRMQRMVRRQQAESGIGTRSQQALKLQHEQNKQEGKTHSRERKLMEAEHRFELKQQRRKEKHRGH